MDTASGRVARPRLKNKAISLATPQTHATQRRNFYEGSLTEKKKFEISLKNYERMDESSCDGLLVITTFSLGHKIERTEKKVNVNIATRRADVQLDVRIK